MYASIVDTIEMTKPKVSLLSIDKIQEEQEKDEECKNIRKAWSDRVPTQYHEDKRGLISRTAPREKRYKYTFQLHYSQDPFSMVTTHPQLVILECSKSAIPCGAFYIGHT